MSAMFSMPKPAVCKETRQAHFRHILDRMSRSVLREAIVDALDGRDLVQVALELDVFSNKDVDEMIVADNAKKGLPSDAPFRLCGGTIDARKEREAYEAARRGDVG